MFELRFDSENSFEYEHEKHEYYDIYLNNQPVHRDAYAILSLLIDRENKFIEIINASEFVFCRIGETRRQELYNLIASLIDELNICDYSIHSIDDPIDHNELMTNELAKVLDDIGFDIKYITY